MSSRAALAFLVAFLHLSNLHGQHTQDKGTVLTDSLGDPLPDGAIARLGTTRLKHNPARLTTVEVALFSPDGAKIASLDNGMSVRLWETASGKQIMGPWTSPNHRYTARILSGRCAVGRRDQWRPVEKETCARRDHPV